MKLSVAEAMTSLENNEGIRFLTGTESSFLDEQPEFQFLVKQSTKILDYIEQRMLALCRQSYQENFFYFYAWILLTANPERYVMSIYHMSGVLVKMQVGGFWLRDMLLSPKIYPLLLEMYTWPMWEACGGINIVPSKKPLG